MVSQRKDVVVEVLNVMASLSHNAESMPSFIHSP